MAVRLRIGLLGGVIGIHWSLALSAGVLLVVVIILFALGGRASFFIGNSYQAQMPEFGRDLGHGDAGVSYSALLAADAAGRSGPRGS